MRNIKHHRNWVPNRRRLLVHWGPHEWTADFAIVSLALAVDPLAPSRDALR